MTHSENATKLIMQFEGCKLTAYQDGNGIWTIGWGHTGPEVHRGLTWNQHQADEALNEDLGHFDVALVSNLAVPVNQNQFDALISFIYNIGPGHFDTSTCKRELNLGHYEAACQAMGLWNKVAGQVSEGLVRRRAAEQKLFSEVIS